MRRCGVTSGRCSLPRRQMPLGIYRGLMVLSWHSGLLVAIIEPTSRLKPSNSQGSIIKSPCEDNSFLSLQRPQTLR